VPGLAGVVTNVTYGLMGFPDSARYVGSKHAVIGVTKAAALEGAPHENRWCSTLAAVACGT
jgi:NAD(P)-dependent dehydrogenase (short-subunit alcohol dehydrogenase family)